MLFALPLTKEMGGLAKVTVGVMIPPTAQDVGGNIDPMNAYPVIHGGKTRRQPRAARRHAVQRRRAGTRLLLQSGRRAGSQRPAGRPDRGVRERRLPGEHDPERRRQPVLRTVQRQLRQRQHGQRQPHPGAAATAGCGSVNTTKRTYDANAAVGGPIFRTGCGSSRRIVCSATRTSWRATGRTDAEHAVLHAGPEPAGDPPAGQRLRRHSLHLSAVRGRTRSPRRGTSSTRTSAWAAARSSRRRPPTSPSTPTRTTCSRASGRRVISNRLLFEVADSTLIFNWPNTPQARGARASRSSTATPASATTPRSPRASASASPASRTSAPRSATSPVRTRSRWASRPRKPGITRGTTTAARRRARRRPRVPTPS